MNGAHPIRAATVRERAARAAAAIRFVSGPLPYGRGSDLVLRRHFNIQNPPSNIRPGFTTVELLISTALMVVAMIGVVGVFNISSTTAARTAGHAEVIEASAALQAELNDRLAHITRGLLIIESPAPTMVRAEVPGGPEYLRLRHDRLVFIATQDHGAFQSFTDPRRGDPIFNRAAEPATSGQALLYFGPGIPVGADGVPQPFSGPTSTLPASQWRFTERAVLLLDQLVGGWNPLAAPNTPTTPPDITAFINAGGMLDGGPLVNVLLESKVDAVWPASNISRSLSTVIADTVLGRTIAGRDTDPTPSKLMALWQPSWAPLTASLSDPVNAPDYYARTGSTFLPRLADFRIEWTDGRRIDPDGEDNSQNTSDDQEGMLTRWFGLAPADTRLFPATPQPDPANPGAMNAVEYQARMRRIADPNNPSNPDAANPDNRPDGTDAETNAFANVEWSPTGIGPDASAAYRAVWRADTWHYRPKALRFTYRIYDSGNRLQQKSTTDLNENGIPDPDTGAGKAVVTRFGQEFSIVVPVP